jgi:hypothetical protein
MTELIHRNYQTSGLDQACTSCEAYKQQYGSLPARMILSSVWQEEMANSTAIQIEGQEVAIEYRNDQYKYDVIVVVEQAQA